MDGSQRSWVTKPEQRGGKKTEENVTTKHVPWGQLPYDVRAASKNTPVMQSRSDAKRFCFFFLSSASVLSCPIKGCFCLSVVWLVGHMSPETLACLFTGTDIMFFFKCFCFFVLSWLPWPVLLIKDHRFAIIISAPFAWTRPLNLLLNLRRSFFSK